MNPIKIGLISLVLATPACAEEFSRDFRSKDFDNQSFRLLGPSAEQFIEATSSGLRIKFLDGANHEPTGIATNFPLRGDFEITAAYEIKTAEVPKIGYGVGIGLYIETDSPTREGLTLERFVMPDASEIFASTRATMKDGERIYYSDRFPAPASGSGTFRLTRRGPTLTASASKAGSTSFRELRVVEVGTGDVTVLRLAGDTGGSNRRVDASFLDLRVKADGFTRTTPPGSGFAVSWTSLLVGLIAVVVAITTFLLSRGKAAPLK